MTRTMNSRFALVAMLAAVEVLILGLILSSLHVGASGFHRVDSDSKSYAPVNAGPAPEVQIEDGDSSVTVTPSTDGLVHITDVRSIHGFTWGSPRNLADLTIARTFTGVTITRHGTGSINGIFGESSQRTEVQVPTGAHVRITNCSGAKVSGLRNSLEVHSQDGRITLADIQGNVVANSDDGSIHLRDVVANSLQAKTADGRIEGMNVAIDGDAARATLHSDDGSIILNGRFASGGNYDFSTNDGRVELALSPNADLTISASTEDGHIYVDGSRYGDGDATAHTIRLGSGTGAMRLATQDGSIHITTNGAT